MAASVWEKQIEPYIDDIAQWVEQGMTDADVARKLGICPNTLRRYDKLGQAGEERYVRLSASLAHARAIADDQIEAALFRSCQGYTIRVQKNYRLKAPGGGEQLVAGEEDLHVPANVDAQKFWLANRRRADWRYKPDEADGGMGGVTAAGIVVIPAATAPDGQAGQGQQGQQAGQDGQDGQQITVDSVAVAGAAEKNA